MATTSVKTLEAHQRKINSLEDAGKEKDSLLARALGEIKVLRNENREQAIRLQMFDDLKLLLHTRPNHGEGMAMSPDIVYEIRQHLNQ